MNLRRRIPDFFVKPRNTSIQVAFTTLFAYAFILIYHPFGSQDWFDVSRGQFAFYTGAVVALGMVVVIISRVIMTQIRKRWPVSIAGYALMIVLEVIAMTGFYMMIQKVFLKDPRFWFDVYILAIQNTVLILLIPYLISLLYFAWEDNKRRLERVASRKPLDDDIRFIPFNDENGELKLTLQLSNLLYLEASENYVDIHYLDAGKVERFTIRTSMKRLEQQLSDFPILRCHRSYMVNLALVKIARKGSTGYQLQLKAPQTINIPVSETYKSKVIPLLTKK